VSVEKPFAAEGVAEEVAALIATLHETGKRLEELTAGEVDTVADREGQTFVLRHAQEQLRHNEADKQASILNALPAHIALLDAQGIIVSVNDAWRRFSATNAIAGSSYVVGLNYFERCDVAGEERSSLAISDGIRSVLNGAAKSFSTEYACHSPTGQHWFLLIVTPLANDRPNGVIVMHVDVTPQKQAEEGLRASELRFRQIAENIDEVFFLQNLDGSQIYYVSPAYEKIWGRSCESLYANPKTWTDSIHPDDLHNAFTHVDEFQDSNFDYDFRIIRPDGEIRWIYIRGFPILNEAGKACRVAGIAADVTQRRLALEEMHESGRRFSDLLRNVELASVMLDLEGRIIYCNEYLLRLTGWTFEEVIGRDWLDVFIPPEQGGMPAMFAALLANEPAAWHHENKILTRSGELRLIRWNNSVLRSGAGDVIGTASIGEDITQRSEQEHKIARLNRIRAVIGGISSAMLRLHDRTALLQEACRVATTEGVFPMAWISVLDPHTGKFDIAAWHGADPQSGDLIMQLNARETWPEADRPSYRVMQTAAPVVVNDLATDPAMAPIREDLLHHGYQSVAAFPLFVETGIVAVLILLAGERDFFDAQEIALLQWLTADLSFALEHIQQSQQLTYLAYYDSLTGLPNLQLFRDRLDQFIHAARQDHGKICVEVVDLENFTRINDTLGRGVGDELLRQVGIRFREFLVEPYTLARIGADTFAVASPLGGDVIAGKLHDCMLEALKQPFHIEGHEVSIAVQAGIALFPADGGDGVSVFKNAEVALKLAKSSGERFVYHSSEMNARVAERLALEKQLRIAIDTQQFVLYYQAKVDMISGEVVGAEALIRWQHPDKGLIGPAEFIALAEETGLIMPIGSWVIHSVCAQQAAWSTAGLCIVPIAVNLSSVQFEKGDVLQTVRDALAVHSIDGKLLELELTESAVMQDSAAAAKTLQALRKLGVGLALDDFGTGYSSLAHLKHFPFNSVKIDSSFVIGITHNAEDAAIATAIIAMAHSLSLKVVAEGVETLGQFNYLQARGCDEMQGFFFSPALAKEVFESDLRSGKRMQLPAPAPADQRTLLLVDDEPRISAALGRMLRRDGYTILTATSGSEGLELLAINSVQVIISDQRMPGMSGTEFLDTVKQMYPDTIRMILSGFTDLEVVTDSVNRGAVFKFLTKPWDDDSLREHVRDAFRRYRPHATR
jgi:diguanylate cyclase (GGDEF)-like protein/PAS domain S-box-containing protein